MDIWIIFSTITIFSNFFLFLIYISYKNILRDARFHLSVSFISLTLWGITQLLNYTLFSEILTLLFVRIAYGLVAILIFHIFNFVKSYTKEETNKHKLSKYLIVDLLIILLSISPILVSSVENINDSVVAHNNDIMLLIFIIALIIFVLLILYNLTKILIHKGNEIIRFSFLLFSLTIILTVILGVAFSYIVPNFTSVQEKTSPIIGYNSTIVFSLVTAYIFSRTQYFSIKSYIGIIFSYLFKIIFSR